VPLDDDDVRRRSAGYRSDAFAMQMLTVVLDAAGVRVLAGRGHRIAVAKSGAAGIPSVVWIAVPPAVLVTITWNETYGVFAGSVPTQAGSSIEIVASLYPARDRSTYAFLDGSFSSPTTEHRIPRNHYDVQNASPAAAAFGLLQAVTAGGRHSIRPVNLIVLPAGGAADFVPDCDIFVWSDAASTSGAVVSHVPARALVVSYASGPPAQRCRYDVDADAFLLDSEINDADGLL
jgi:hypothetical protein